MKNKNIRRIFSLLLAVILIIFTMPIVNAAEDGIIRNDESGIPDTNLYNALLQIADINGDGILTADEAENYSEDVLNISQKSVHSLKGIDYFKNITYLNVSENELIDLKGIEGINNLIELKAVSNKLVDISSILTFPDISFINFSENELSYLPDMKNFNNISEPYVSFHCNKLSHKEMVSKLPEYLSEKFYMWDLTQTPDPESMNLVDTDTGVEVSGLMHPDANLNVESVENSVENAVSSFDITLVKDGNIIQPDGTITIFIPSEYGDCEVFWIKDDGTKVNMNAEYVDGKYVFTTDYLSIYALVRNNVPTVPEPTETVPVPTETVPEPTVTDPIPTETVPEPTETDPIPTETVPEPTETDPIPTETVPEPTETDPVPTETVPEPTETDPAPTETVPEPAVTDPITTEPTTTEPTTTAPVVTPDTPSNGNNGSNGSSSNTPSGNSSNTNTNTSNGAVATGDMFGIDNSILIALILAATTAMIIASKKRQDSSK